MNEVTEEWVVKAESDFDAADLTLHGRELPIVDAVCFHSQQCVEKYLKAFLQEHGVRFERTHVLASLLELCLTVDKEFKKIAGELDSLEGYAVAIRYPGAVVPAEMAEQAYLVAEKVRKFIRKKLNLK